MCVLLARITPRSPLLVLTASRRATQTLDIVVIVVVVAVIGVISAVVFVVVFVDVFVVVVILVSCSISLCCPTLLSPLYPLLLLSVLPGAGGRAALLLPS